MTQPLKVLIYFLMIVIGLFAMYTILNAGNPNSILRPYFPDTGSDIYLALVSSLAVFILGFFVFFSRDQEGFKQIITLNEKRIRVMRKDGKKDAEIADSILAAMGTRGGYKHNMARKKLVAYLAEFK